jgi:hypothetical protein
MEQEKKDKIAAAADKVAVGAFAKAKLLTGWRKWVAIVIGTLAAGAAAWLAAGCAAAVKQDADGFRGVIVILPEGGK